MADKKVERTGRERPLTPRQKLTAALSDTGTVNMAAPTHDKGKSALVDRFRDREERWRREQALHDRQAAHEVEHSKQEATEGGEPTEPEGRGEGGES